jgi:hypothetical protein
MIDSSRNCEYLKLDKKMFLRTCISTILIFIACAGLAHAAGSGNPDPLFSDDSILDIRIVAPFKQIMKERPTNGDDSNDNHPQGTFSFVSADGSNVEFDVKIVTRGNNRRREDVCPFAPLRLDFKKDDLDDTLFDKQNKLKLVTHCDNGSKVYQQAVIKEYLAYRILNAMTDISFRVRLLRMTYVYSDRNNDEEVTYGFLIESKNRMAKRIGLEEQDLNAMSITLLDREYANLSSVYQYLIGNLDFSPVIGAAGETCCHNYALFSADRNTYWSIPYDFDLTGFVEAPHHNLNPKYNLRNARQRLYHGFCYNQEYVPATLQKFRDRRADIEAVIAEQPELDKSARKRVDSYIKSFYKLLDKEDKLLKQFADDCLG